MPLYTINRTRTRKVYESFTFEVEAPSEEEARENVDENFDGEDWHEDDSEILSIHTDVIEILNPDMS